MSQATADFFDRKKPWSRIKDSVIGSYLPQYLAMVSQLRRPIILVDAFAGPGVFRDPDTGRSEYGSPIIMCEAAKWARCPHRMFFGNKRRSHHNRLQAELDARQIPEAQATAVQMDSQELLTELAYIITDETLFLYLDPFGYTGCEMDGLKPLVERSPRYSTELIFNLDVADLHRLASRHALRNKGTTPQIAESHSLLMSVLMGDWWKDILLSDDPDFTAAEKELLIVQGYIERYKPYFKYRGYCPVPDKAGGKAKYYITFFSNHPDALVAHNDNMFRAYHTFVAKDRWSVGMFKEGVEKGAIEVGWRDVVSPDAFSLDPLIVEAVYLANKAGKSTARKETWVRILNEHGHFMKWTQPQFLRRVEALRDRGQLGPSVRDARRINDDCRLFLPAIGAEPMEPRQLGLDEIA